MKQKNKSIIQSIRESLPGTPDQAVNNAALLVNKWPDMGGPGAGQMGHCMVT